MIIISIFKFFANIVYMPFKLLRTRRKITFISRQSNYLPLEFKLIIKKIKKEAVEIKTINKKLEFNLTSLIINLGIFFIQMYHIASSKIVIVDGYCIPVSILNHKKELVVIQTWHANVIIKKIGLQTLKSKSNMQKQLALKMNMHKNYDYVLSSSDFTSRVYLKAFDIKKSNILKIGTPILDYLYDGSYHLKSEEIKRKYKLGKKKNIVYMPTIRKDKDIDIENFIRSFDFNSYNLILKPHPVQHMKDLNKNIILIENYTGEEVLSIADYVISDYSNIFVEAILINKPVFLYLYDFNDYKINPGLNIDLYEELPNNSFSNISIILEKIKRNELHRKDLKNFSNKYIGTYDGKCNDRIVGFLLSKLSESS